MLYTRKAVLAAGLYLIAPSGSHAERVRGIPCDAMCQIGLSSDAPASTEQSQPQNAPGLMVRVRPGRASMVNDYYSLEPDCRSRGPVQIFISDSPRHGGVSVDESRMRPRFDNGDDMAVCNRKAVPVTRVFYEPQPGVAEDSFSLSVTFPDGETREEAYRVTVR